MAESVVQARGLRVDERRGRSRVAWPGWAALLAVALFFCLSIYRFWPHTLDDSFISFTYARDLASGRGMVFNPGERVEGFSDPLWVLLLAAVTWVGLPVVSAAKALGACAAFASVLLAAVAAFAAARFIETQERSSRSMHDKPSGRSGRRHRGKSQAATTPAASESGMSRHVPVLAALLCAAAMVAQPGFAYYGVAGLETTLFGLLVLLGVVLHLMPFIGRGARGSRWCYLPLGAAAITRPEGGMFLLLVTVHRAWLCRRTIPHDGSESTMRGHLALKPELLPAAIGWLMPAVYAVWRLIYFGDLLPNTFFAKPGTFFQNPTGGVEYLWKFVSAFGLASVVIIAPCVAVTWFRSPLKRVIRVLVLLIAAYTGFIIYAGGDWMAQGRFFQHILPLICLTAALSLATPVIRFHQPLFLLLLALCIWRGKDVAVFWRDLDANTRYDQAHSSKYNVEMAQWMGRNLPPGATIVTDEIGAIGYYSGLRVLDKWGLIDKPVAGILHRSGFNPYGSPNKGDLRPRVQTQIAQELMSRDPDYVLIDYVGPWPSGNGYDPKLVNPLAMRELHTAMANNYELVRGFRMMYERPKTFLLFRRSGPADDTNRSTADN